MWQLLKRLAGHSAIYGLGNAAISLLSFLMIPLFTHHMTTPEFGVYSLVMIVYGLLATLVDFGYTNSVGRYYFAEDENLDEKELATRRSTVLTTAVTLSWAMAILVGTVLYFSAEAATSHFLGDDFKPVYLQIIACAVFFQGLTVVPFMTLRVTERPGTYVSITVLQVLSFFCLNIITLAHLGLGVKGALISLAASKAIAAAASLFTFKPAKTYRFDKQTALSLTRFGVPFLPVLLMMWVVDFSDRYLLELHATTEEVGIYSLGYKLGQSMLFLVTAFSAGWVPIRFRLLELSDNRSVYGRIASFYIFIAGFCWLLLSLISREIIDLTSPKEFSTAYQFIAPVAFGYMLYGLFVVSVTGAGIARRSAHLPVIVGLAATLNISLNLAFIPTYGGMAAAWSTIVSYTVMLVGGVYTSQKMYEIHYEYDVGIKLLLAQLSLGIIGLVAVPQTFVGYLIKISFVPIFLWLSLRAGLLKTNEIVSFAQSIPKASETTKLQVSRLLLACAGLPQSAAKPQTPETEGDPHANPIRS